ncbi:hypothetical protein EVAR_4871_1 [Eumeta japonica]|uniref:Uncharacterized protein n=1 Tax=Eumeta variegata TaxID=151549 RepID=A0A4C1T2M6_EUMVA|nr:hypothetical protein EVAR_4871_1 [Eumeta japonica]
MIENENSPVTRNGLRAERDTYKRKNAAECLKICVAMRAHHAQRQLLDKIVRSARIVAPQKLCRNVVQRSRTNKQKHTKRQTRETDRRKRGPGGRRDAGSEQFD